jgi:hypothetical protein
MRDCGQLRQIPYLLKSLHFRRCLRRKTIIYNLKSAPKPYRDDGFSTMKYYGPWLYTRSESNTVELRQDPG